ncbi:hypothetical protein CsSME_00032769 [Camellia sinensis var. sinensis]
MYVFLLQNKIRASLVCSHFFFLMLFRLSFFFTTSKRLAERKVEKFEKNISKRGLPKKGYNYSVELIVLGLLLFVIVGSYIFQMIRAATSGEIA